VDVIVKRFPTLEPAETDDKLEGVCGENRLVDVACASSRVA
jgi:hypothetical protein